MDVTLLGERVFADAVKDPEMISSWISWVSPKPTVIVSQETETGPAQRRGAGNITTEAETEIMWPQCTEQLDPQKLEEMRKDFS